MLNESFRLLVNDITAPLSFTTAIQKLNWNTPVGDRQFYRRLSFFLFFFWTTLHSRLNALKYNFEQVLKKEKFFWEIPRPKKPIQLPKVLNEPELRKLFNALQNKKHKTMVLQLIVQACG